MILLLHYFILFIGFSFFAVFMGICTVAANRFVLDWLRKEEL